MVKIMINPARRVNRIELSQIRKMFVAPNPDTVNLGIGEPDFDVPENIKLAMQEAINENDTHYTPNKGYEELQEVIANKLDKDNNIKTEADNVIITAGASEALYACSQAFFDKGDEIILPNPSFLGYSAWIKLSDATPVFADCYFENEFKLKAEDVEKKITDKTKAIILNSPSNPTGSVMDKEDVKAIVDLATDNDILIISDEIYEKIIYKGKHYSSGAYSDNVITINGFSKTYAMTGLRVGYLNANEQFNEELLKIHQYCVACTSSISQRGALEALTGPQDSVKKMVKEFKRRRDLIVTSLNDLGYPTCNAGGAFYVFPQVDDSNTFVQKALDNGVVTVGGSAFGSNGKNHVRMSYANSYENIELAMERLSKI